MADPLGLLGGPSPIDRNPAQVRRPDAPGDAGPDFKNALVDQIARVNELQQNAEAAAQDLIAGRRDDLENVMSATQQADTAFRLLLQVRNRVMEAYEEVKQIRV